MHPGCGERIRLANLPIAPCPPSSKRSSVASIPEHIGIGDCLAALSDAHVFELGTGLNRGEAHPTGSRLSRPRIDQLYWQDYVAAILAKHLLHIVIRRAKRCEVVVPNQVGSPLPGIFMSEQRRVR